MTKSREGDPGGPFHDMLGQLRRAPWRFGFLSLLRRFGASHLQHPPVGLAQRPQQEPFRLGQAAALTFAPREIAGVVLPGESEHRVPGASPTRPAATSRA